MAINQAGSYLLEIANGDAEEKELQSLIPEEFYRQAEKGFTKFQISADLISDSVYTGRQNSEQEYFRLVIQELSYLEEEEEVHFKIKLQGIMNPETGEMIPMRRGETNSDGEWLQGLNSPKLCLSKEDVAEGLISEREFASLVKYAKFWESKGNDLMYETPNSRTRVWLTAGNPDFKFQFILETRTNPKTNELTIGIADVSWVNGQLIGSGVLQPANRVGKAASLVKGDGVKIPSFRNVAPKTIKEEEKVATPPKSNRGRGRKPVEPPF